MEKNFILDNQLFADLVDNWTENVKQFTTQNTAIIINNVTPLYESDIIDFVRDTVGKTIEEDQILIDRQFIQEHFHGFTINPYVDELKTGYTSQCELRPDVSCIDYR